MTWHAPLGHRLALLLVRLRIARADREGLIGDLLELAAVRRAAGTGWLAASLTYWRELAGVLASYRSPTTPFDPEPRPQGDRLVSQLVRDLRLALRGFRHAPLFTALAVLTLALGIGTTTAMFSVLNPILLEPLPYPEGDRIVTIWERDPVGERSTVGFATYADLRQDAPTLTTAAALGQGEAILLGDGEPERLTTLRVSHEYFTVLGVAPLLGRAFLPEEDQPGSGRVAVLSHGLWQRRFGGDPAIIGRAVVMSDVPYTIIGVMGPGFQDYLAPQAQFWTTLRYDAQPWACRTCRHLRVVARLAPGVPFTTAQRQLDLRFTQLVTDYPDDYRSVGTAVVPLQAHLTAGIRTGLVGVAVGVVCVLLIAAANVMNLQLGRAARREAEFAIRGALGAGRGQVVRQLLTENLVLALVGGAAGVVLAWGGVRLLTSLGDLSLHRLDAVRLDLSVLAFAAGVTLLTGLLFGMAPALVSGRADLQGALRQGRRVGGSRHGLRAGLVVAEVGLALALLAGAGLMMRSLTRLLAVDMGFDPRGLLTMEVRVVGSRYDSLSALMGFSDQVTRAVRDLPGVASVGWTSMLPLGGDFSRSLVRIASVPLESPADAPRADRYLVHADYLATMGIAVVRGRGFRAEDRAGASPVAVINETFASQHWPGRDPLGDRVQLSGPEHPWWTIIGIVRDVKHIALDATPTPQIYLPQSQWMFNEGLGGLVVRVSDDPAAFIEPVRRAIRSVDPNTPIARVATMDDLLAGTTAVRRYAMLLFGAFAAVALLLAAAGIYGVLANSVQERTREIGIRTALGATRRSILTQVLGQGLWLTTLGVLFGGIGALALSRVLRGLLFGVAPHDPVTFAGVVVVLMATALLACWIPARRAASVPPAEVLRE